MDSYLNSPCERCGSKKLVSKTWSEIVPTIIGTKYEEFSQIICTNTICQAAFDKNLLAETEERTVRRIQREENAITRKANSLLAANKTRKKNKELKNL